MVESSAMNSSSSELPPALEQVIDHFNGFLPISFLEPARCAKYSLSIVYAQQHGLVLKSARAQLYARIVCDGKEIADRLEVFQATLTIGRIQAAELPLLQPRTTR